MALVRARVSVPAMEPEKLELVRRQLDDAGITAEHDVLGARGEVGLETLAERGVEVKSMGRTVEQDREFFLAGGAAGAVAAERLTWTGNSESG